MILSVSPFRLTIGRGMIYTEKTLLSEFLDSMTIFTSPSVINPPWRSYKMESKDWIFVFFFKEQTLWRITLHSTLIKSDWSEESALEEKHWYDQWLKQHIGLSPCKYPWGQIQSFGSERSGAGIAITFYTE